MAHGEVIALHEIFGEHLPVRVPDKFFLEVLDIVFHAVIGDQFLNVGKFLVRRLRIGIEGDHHPAQPFLAADLRQAVVVFAEAFIVRHGGCGAERTIEVVAPAVIGADDGSGIALVLQKDGHAMQANIGLGVQCTVPVTDHHDGLVSEFQGYIITGF